MAKKEKEKKAPAKLAPAKKEPKKKAQPLPALPKPKAAAAPKERKEPAEAPILKEPVLVEQKGYKGEAEQVDFNQYSNVITCSVPGCGEIRYVKNADRHQVTMCKPCARRARRRRIRENRKARGKVSNFVEQKKAAKAAKK